MKITKYHEQPIKDTPHKVDVRQMYNQDSAQAIAYGVKAGRKSETTQNPGGCIFLYSGGYPYHSYRRRK